MGRRNAVLFQAVKGATKVGVDLMRVRVYGKRREAAPLLPGGHEESPEAIPEPPASAGGAARRDAIEDDVAGEARAHMIAICVSLRFDLSLTARIRLRTRVRNLRGPRFPLLSHWTPSLGCRARQPSAERCSARQVARVKVKGSEKQDGARPPRSRACDGSTADAGTRSSATRRRA